MLQSTDNTFWTVDGTDVVMFQTNNGFADGRKTFENRMSIDQFANLNAYIWEHSQGATPPTPDEITITNNPELQSADTEADLALTVVSPEIPPAQLTPGGVLFVEDTHSTPDEIEPEDTLSAVIADIKAITATAESEDFQPLASGTFDEDKAE